MKDRSKGGLSLGIKLGYGIGDVGSNFFIITTGMFLLYFLTSVLGIEPAIAGLVLLFPKLWDVVSDPIMGAISDATKSRMGRRRPYLLYGSVPFGFSLFFLFFVPGYESDIAAGIHVGIVFAVVCTVFTVINVPYSSMVAEMSDSYNERMSITSFRMTFSSIGVLLAGGLAMPLVNIGGGGEAGFLFMSIVFGIIMTLSCLICFKATKNTRFLFSKEKTPAMGEQIKIALRNRPFIMLLMSYFFQALAAGILMAGMIYYVKYVMMLPETSMGIIFPVFLGSAILFIPFWVKVGLKLGKIKAYTIGLCFLALMLFSLFFSRPTHTNLFYGQIFLLGIGFSSFQLFPFSMLPDTIEFDEMQSGLRREGIFSGSWAAGQKIAFSVGPSIVGFALSFSGFVAEGVQPESVDLGIRIVFCLLPVVMMLLSFIPFSKYDLTEKRFEEIKQKLDTQK
ncbi:MAG: MFS transporter [Deltaproteobacteria bacterium]|nr:MFS transporter [Deltaproteobacteria bacterium]